MEGRIAFPAGVADQDVDGSKFTHRCVEHGLDLGLVGDIGLYGHCALSPAAYLFGHHLGVRGVGDVVHDHVRARFSERDGDGAADAGIGAGHQRSLSF
ncbi:hypothetical protein D3C87_1493440 [compost metagenome]